MAANGVCPDSAPCRPPGSPPEIRAGARRLKVPVGCALGTPPHQGSGGGPRHGGRSGSPPPPRAAGFTRLPVGMALGSTSPRRASPPRLPSEPRCPSARAREALQNGTAHGAATASGAGAASAGAALPGPDTSERGGRCAPAPSGGILVPAAAAAPARRPRAASAGAPGASPPRPRGAGRRRPLPLLPEPGSPPKSPVRRRGASRTTDWRRGDHDDGCAVALCLLCTSELAGRRGVEAAAANALVALALHLRPAAPQPSLGAALPTLWGASYRCAPTGGASAGGDASRDTGSELQSFRSGVEWRGTELCLLPLQQGSHAPPSGLCSSGASPEVEWDRVVAVASDLADWDRQLRTREASLLACDGLVTVESASEDDSQHGADDSYVSTQPGRLLHPREGGPRQRCAGRCSAVHPPQLRPRGGTPPRERRGSPAQVEPLTPRSPPPRPPPPGVRLSTCMPTVRQSSFLSHYTAAEQSPSTPLTGRVNFGTELYQQWLRVVAREQHHRLPDGVGHEAWDRLQREGRRSPCALRVSL
eukprot:TRINITY_DN2637_c1_g1_i1.p1 TRINITY_DN2637_c1_g1~~TRINITY_DN2637_c1_g1_i1.p1  ORF type:complete len:556 (+),score=35.83 TRINITY_DN2637_c1_g1_i1:72-1670(+)